VANVEAMVLFGFRKHYTFGFIDSLTIVFFVNLSLYQTKPIFWRTFLRAEYEK
jgi:hypothetical protein